eukprot:12919832-Prorocentrum_lima.AAC.1
MGTSQHQGCIREGNTRRTHEWGICFGEPLPNTTVPDPFSDAEWVASIKQHMNTLQEDMARLQMTMDKYCKKKGR